MAINQIDAADVNAFEHVQDMNRYQVIATKSAIYPGQRTPLGLAYCALKLNGEAGELAEHVGKAMRDDKFMGDGTMKEMPVFNSSTNNITYERVGLQLIVTPLTPERREFLIKEIGDCLWYLSALCNELGITLGYAALTNLRKLFDRTQRNKLQGSGDNR